MRDASGRGDGDDIAELYRRHAPALHRRCASIVGNAEEARDLVQETFARYISARANWTDRASPFTVLYRIATNASIDRLRRRKTATEEELDPETRAATSAASRGGSTTSTISRCSREVSPRRS